MPQICTAAATMAVTSSLALASVCTKRTSASNSSRQAGGDRLAGLVVDFGHQDPGPLAGEAAHNAPPDAVASARDDGHLAPQSVGHDGPTVASKLSPAR